MGNRPPTCGKACTNCAADCARPVNGLSDELEDDRPGGDPAGATFEETLEDLNSLDRNLMLFCATSNLAAVRWLLHLGAHWDVCDTNGTSCLHVACRAGVLAVVRELARHEHLLEATDVAGWTALHIAVLMGRTEVVMHLLRCGASPIAKNSKGQIPEELCADNTTQEVLHAFQTFAQQGRPASHFSKDTRGVGEDVVAARLQYEPFFVPRQPFLRSSNHKKELQRIGVAVVDSQPGYGLAFLVSTGVIRDYPVDLSSFLRRSKVSRTQVGCFLGEAFSLAHTIRLEYVNSVSLKDTGVVSAMVRSFHSMQLPDDLQKIDRLVHAVARIWWRQHDKMAKDGHFGEQPSSAHGYEEDNVQELTGLELKQYLTSPDALHQAMFSTVLLHWYMHRDGSGFRRLMDFRSWKELNAGIEASASDVPDHILQRVYSIVSRGFIPEIAVAPTNAGTRETPTAGGGADAGGGLGTAPSWASMLSATAPLSVPPLEGWVQLVGGGFPHAANPTGSGTVSYKSISNIFSEVTDYSGLMQKSPFDAHMDQAGDHAHSKKWPMSSVGKATLEAASSSRREDWVWVTSGCDLLFFASDPHDGFPYAFTDLRKLSLYALRPQMKTVTLVGGGDLEGRMVMNDVHAQPGNPQVTGGTPTPPISVVLLLPDGRWQELSLGKLELRVPKVAELEQWSQKLERAHGKTVELPGGDSDPQP